MRRRDFIKAVAGSAATWPLGARGQQNVRRIGALIALAEADTEGKAWVAGFRQGLEQRGWSEDRNLHIDYRCAGWRSSTGARERAGRPTARRDLRNPDAGCCRATTGDPRDTNRV